MAATVGGRVEITINGATYHPVAEVNMEESSIEAESVTNQDGTIGRSVKPKPFKAEVTYRFGPGFNIDLLMGASFDWTMIERDTGRSVLLTNAFHEGTPKRNTVNGEVSGLTVVSDQWRRV